MNIFSSKTEGSIFEDATTIPALETYSAKSEDSRLEVAVVVPKMESYSTKTEESKLLLTTVAPESKVHSSKRGEPKLEDTTVVPDLESYDTKIEGPRLEVIAVLPAFESYSTKIVESRLVDKTVSELNTYSSKTDGPELKYTKIGPELQSDSSEIQKPWSGILAVVPQFVSYSTKKEESLWRDSTVIPELKLYSPKTEETILGDSAIVPEAETCSTRTEETYFGRMTAEVGQQQELATEPTLNATLKPAPPKTVTEKQLELISSEPNMKLELETEYIKNISTEMQENSEMKPVMTENTNTVLLKTSTETRLKLFPTHPSNIFEVEAYYIRNVSAEVQQDVEMKTLLIERPKAVALKATTEPRIELSAKPTTKSELEEKYVRNILAKLHLDVECKTIKIETHTSVPPNAKSDKQPKFLSPALSNKSKLKAEHINHCRRNTATVRN